jgi:hypothetical protein
MNFWFYLQGFLAAAFHKKPKLLSREERRFLRGVQYRRLFSETKVMAEYALQE